MDYYEAMIRLTELNMKNRKEEKDIKESNSTLNTKKVEYNASLDVLEGKEALAVFIKPKFRNHIKFNKEAWQVILELPITLVWDMLRNNLVSANFSEDQVELIRRKNEALAAEKYLEEYEKT